MLTWCVCSLPVKLKKGKKYVKRSCLALLQVCFYWLDMRKDLLETCSLIKLPRYKCLMSCLGLRCLFLYSDTCISQVLSARPVGMSGMPQGMEWNRRVLFRQMNHTSVSHEHSQNQGAVVSPSSLAHCLLLSPTDTMRCLNNTFATLQNAKGLLCTRVGSEVSLRKPHPNCLHARSHLGVLLNIC